MENNENIYKEFDNVIEKYNKSNKVDFTVIDSGGLLAASYQLGKAIAENEMNKFPDMSETSFIRHCRSQFHGHKNYRVAKKEIDDIYKSVGNFNFWHSVWEVYNTGLDKASVEVWEESKKDLSINQQRR